MNTTTPFYFDEFFASGKEETISPFLTPASRAWGKNLAVRSSLLSALFLLLAFVSSFYSPSFSVILLSVVYFFAGTPALIHALQDMRNFEINIDVLMTLAALLSVLIGSALEGALLLVLFEISGAMEDNVSQKTKSALLSLHQLSPRIATVLQEDGTIYEKSVKEISIGTNLLVRAGEIIPLDGTVLAGSSFVNLAHLTGESQPLSKQQGDEVPAGGGNLDGTLTIRVIRTSSDSTLNRIIQLITQAQETKPRVQQFLDRFGKWYATTIILLSLFFAFLLPFLLNIPFLGKEGGIYRALTFLIAASPCALIIATPTAYLSAISSCARKGILLKGGVTLDALATCHTIAFDKTGTLTSGELICEEMKQLSGPPFDPLKALQIAASLERHAVHPMARAILEYADKQGVTPLNIDQFRSLSGLGLEGVFENTPVYIGHPDLISSKLRKQPALPPSDSLFTYLLIDQSLFLFHFVDKIRPNMSSVIENLKAKGLAVVMLTGDHSEQAQTVAKELSIENVFANLRPEDKLKKVEELAKTTGLMMVGDGINDAPALARATVGISMGKVGSGSAVEASDIVLLNDDLTLLTWLYGKAKQTLAIVKQNLALALGVICLVTTPALLGLVPLWLAVILHEGGTVIVGLNSLRLLKKSG